MSGEQPVYHSAHRPDCTSIRNSLRKQGIKEAWVCPSTGDEWAVMVPVKRYREAYSIVWGDEEVMALNHGYQAPTEEPCQSKT
jgi:hypothetical protein